MEGYKEYLLTHGIDLTKKGMTKADIISNKEELSRVAGYVTDGRDILETIVGARIEALKEELQYHASPFEVLEIRRCIVEFSLLLQDFDAYVEENDRARKKRAGETDEASGEEAPQSTL